MRTSPVRASAARPGRDTTRGDLRFLAFLLWPVVPILGLVGFGPAVVGLVALGVAPHAAAALILLATLASGIGGAALRLLVGTGS